MRQAWLPFASYNLWSLSNSRVGQEFLFCDMNRGFKKVRQKEPQVKVLLEDNKHQRIGKLAQAGVYEFYQDPKLLSQSDGVEKVAAILKLNQEPEEVQERIIRILKNYCKEPILVGKQIIQLSKGDEGFPSPIIIQEGSYCFNLYAPTDCTFKQPDGTIHILDFKTGKSDFDRRQAYVYLLAASYLYPQQPSVASFYNLEIGLTSDIIIATSEQLKFVQIELQDIAKQHELEKKRYWENPDDFATIFPPNPGTSCNYCIFSSICKFSVCEVLR
ncbi:PD-(D/E)XK nuclease family protein [Plectonema radiosum NIES-515]|uniref:PD-(D/E)XK nuclease family protein n=1 Tax=Plectonema radiosum NIES-515 TaxID=2986073 RepID=A0ABT3AWR9_9CYAN|nr:PD-(D/E)XK nuclease family protein [Plectonema radiosum]MCV3213571.1 PD-(D/E)XK nuclease family protein [Plectonema radiosum NIES-515]